MTIGGFWGYLFGLMAFWGGLSSLDSSSELSKFIFLLVNVGLIATALVLVRRAFLVFGALGVPPPGRTIISRSAVAPNHARGEAVTRVRGLT